MRKSEVVNMTVNVDLHETGLMLRYQNKKREFKICRCRILFDEKIEHDKKYETWIKKAKNVLLLCKVLLICYFTQ